MFALRPKGDYLGASWRLDVDVELSRLFAGHEGLLVGRLGDDLDGEGLIANSAFVVD